VSRRSLRVALLASSALLSLVFATGAGAAVHVETPAGHVVSDTSADLYGMAYSYMGGTVSEPVSYHFEYGTTNAYGSATPERTGKNNLPAETIAGLTPGTLYHVRLVATDADGTVASSDATFTTSTPVAGPPPPAGPQGPADTDGDRVFDLGDQCPSEPGTVDAFGCPDPDADHLGGADDKCPTQAGTRRASGCPDADNDGVSDATDKCPNSSGDEYTHGCDDTDEDGVDGTTDKCPSMYGPQRADGCPLARFTAALLWTRPVQTKNLGISGVIIGCLYRTKARGCSFDVTVKLTAASARELHVSDPTIFSVHGQATKREHYTNGGGFDRFDKSQIVIAPAMAAALAKARRVTFEVSGSYHWASEKDQALKTTGGKTVERYTLTRKGVHNYHKGLFSKQPALKPQPPEEG
jgi:hypothetical protein